jgi:hypothetical protein
VNNEFGEGAVLGGRGPSPVGGLQAARTGVRFGSVVEPGQSRDSSWQPRHSQRRQSYRETTMPSLPGLSFRVVCAAALCLLEILESGCE